MHQEISKRNKISFLQVAGSILVLALLLFIFNGILSLLPVDRTLLDLVWLMLAAVFTYRFIRMNLISFKYMMIEDEFIVQELVGTKEKVIININAGQIVEAGSVESEAYGKLDRRSFLSVKKLFNSDRDEEKFYMVYEEDADRHLVIFQPTSRLIEVLEEKSKIKF